MSDSYTPPEQRTPGSTVPKRWWPHGWNLGALQAWWMRKRGSQAVAGAGSIGPAQGVGIGLWLVIAFGILLCLPIVGVILGYIARPPAGTASIVPGGSSSEASSDSAARIPKPAPGKPMAPVSEAPPPSVVHSPSDSAIAPVSPPQVAVPLSPITSPGPAVPQPSTAVPQPAAPAPAGGAFAAVTYPARHDRHFGGECNGQLTLNSAALVFNCPADPGSGFQVPVNQIDGVDENGVRLFTGKKYHFTINGMNKGAERALFADWLSRVR